ncbi:uncharacterized protein LOC128992503 [Macrosteles quadrilineatus]|uniref:uncharacterized protein LOC128992503 n=1 Tax=Macrosteles quadrilineatus TaxID=74068 RepID=UPI0023E175E4|nr:uncharacterized protein LOC128992503 [Macrosteles quadrilineatus]
MGDEFQSQFTLSIIPLELQDVEKQLLNLKQSRIAEYRKPIISFFEKQSAKCDKLYQQCSEQKRVLQEEIQQLTGDTEHIKKEVYEMQLEENMIRNNIKTQKQILSNTEKQSPDTDELAELMRKVCSLKEDIEKKKSNLKNEMDMYKRGILFYKKYLHCKVMLETKDTLIITFDTSVKTADEAREYLRFSAQEDGKTFQYLEMQPKLKCEKQLVKIFNDTGDIQGFVVSFWKMIKGANPRKVLREQN